MVQLGREARDFPPCPEKQSPFSHQSFSKYCVCPLHQQGSDTGTLSGQAGFWGWLQLGCFQEMGLKVCGVQQPLLCYQTLSALSHSHRRNSTCFTALVLAGMQLVFFMAAHRVMWFGFMTKAVLIKH